MRGESAILLLPVEVDTGEQLGRPIPPPTLKHPVRGRRRWRWRTAARWKLQMLVKVFLMS